VFDYKTGIVTWNNGSAPAANQYVYISTYQYVGRTLRSQLDDGSITSNYTTLFNVPVGLISSSQQITDFGFISTSASAAAAGFGSGGGSLTDISALNIFSGSIQTEVTIH
jgi:hypothetical protein